MILFSPDHLFHQLVSQKWKVWFKKGNAQDIMKQFTRALHVFALDFLQGERPPCPRCGMSGGTSVSYAAAIQVT